MADTIYYPLEACLQNATERQTAYAGGELRLYKDSLIPTASTPLSAYDAAECNFTGYAAATIAAWADPILAPGSGFMILSSAVQFTTGAGPVTTTNSVGGCYYVDSGGILRIAVQFGASVPMEVPYAGIPLQLVDLFPTGL